MRIVRPKKARRTSASSVAGRADTTRPELRRSTGQNVDVKELRKLLATTVIRTDAF
jgi:hypothetical protein